MSKKITETPNGVDIRKLQPSGQAIKLMIWGAGYNLRNYKDKAKEHKSRDGGEIPVTYRGIQDSLSRRRTLPDVYLEVLQELIGKESYQKWLEVVYRERPDLFSEATIK